MRIEKIRFKNINSLSGEWEIDLTDPAYLSGGIFAIVGDTGAGKTSILDAICLALYGETPRVNISGNSNAVMTQTAGECYADVIFSNDKGRFCCHWGQKRARGRSDGKLQSILHQITPITGQKLQGAICRTSTASKAKIEEITGMTFDEFTRSVMLAQGQFAAFLKAKPDERSPILEKITGTEIYTQISKSVHERAMQEKKNLDQLEARVNDWPIMSNEMLQQLQITLSEKKQMAQQCYQQRQKVVEALQWYQKIADLEKDLARLQEKEHKHKTDVIAFMPKQIELDQALKAVDVDASYQAFNMNRSCQKACLQQLKELDDIRIPALIQAKEMAESAQKQANTEKEIAQKAFNDYLEIFHEICLLDQQIADLKQRVETSKQYVNESRNTCIEIERHKKQVEVEQDKITQQINELVSWRSQHAVDQELIASFSNIATQFKDLIAIQKIIDQKKDELKRIDVANEINLKNQAFYQAAFNEKQQQRIQVEKDLETITHQFSQCLSGQSLETLRKNRELLIEKRHQQALYVSFKEQRKYLKSGEPCPCCGSLEHPFVSDHVFQIETIDHDIQQIEAQIHQVEMLEKKQRIAEKHLMQLKADYVAAQSEKKIADAAVIQMTERANQQQKDLKAAILQYTQKGDDVLANLKQFGITQMPLDAQKCIHDLEKRLKTWQQKESNYQQYLQQADQMAHQIQMIAHQLKFQRDTLDEKLNEYNKLNEQFKVMKSNRFQRFGAENPNIKRDKLKNRIQEKEADLKQKQLIFQQQDKALEISKTQKQAKAQELEILKANALALTHQFHSKLKQAEFIDEVMYLNAKRSQKEREALSEKAQQIKEQGIELRAQLQAKCRALDEEKAKHLTEIPLQVLSEQCAQVDEQINECVRQQGEIVEKLRSDADNREKRQGIQHQIDQQNKIYEEWDMLRGLIGHHDGKEFRNFVQSLTFEFVINCANEQLQKMDSRYLLQPAKENGLDLMVIDHWQGDLIRTIKNLSGGESFIVSLALALGLSDITGHKDQIDSLFLDEGFGTLDEETLNIAMNTLSDLNQQGRLIGIISHVEALKERITTQIEVIKNSDGTSRLQGAGCSRIS